MKPLPLRALLCGLLLLAPVLRAGEEDIQLPPPPDPEKVLRPAAPVPADPLLPGEIPLPPGEYTDRGLIVESPAFTPEATEPPLPDDLLPPPMADHRALTPDISPAPIEPLEPEAAAPALPGDTTVSDQDLAPAPAPLTDPTTTVPLSDRGPLFRIPGTDAVDFTRQLGYHFTPAGGMGRRDGIHTVAAQFPSILTSEVHGTRMTQLCPPATWNTLATNNIFFMFCDAEFNAVRLTPGWKVRGIQLKGPNWQWVACPKSGSSSVSFSVRLISKKTARTGTVVTLTGITLEGPPGAKDWKAAFPSLKNPAPVAER